MEPYFILLPMPSFNKTAAYKTSIQQLNSLLENETDRIMKMATINCVLKTNFPYYFWVGFYIVKDNELIVGPYQGTLCCLHIKFGKGVCGTAAQERKTQLVLDVHAFPGHIACDSASESEIVVPVFNKNEKLIAVFDVDSTEKGSFDKIDQKYLEQILKTHFSEKPLEG